MYALRRFVLASLFLALAVSATAEAKRPFYVIAHMTNTVGAVRWAMAEGANALEMDLRFTSAGEPDTFRHGGGIICDCICAVGSNHVCGALGRNCEAAVSVRTMFAELVKHSRLALLLLDTKITAADSTATQEAAGRRIVQVLETDLFARGFRGRVVISAGHPDVFAYLQKAAQQAAASRYGSRIFFAFDQEGGAAENASCTLKTLARLPSKNRVFGTGVSACATGNFTDAIKMAATNRDAGVAGLVYVWTLDAESSMKHYIQSGVDGILTNIPRKLAALARARRLSLATPDSPLPIPTNANVRGGGRCGCDCDYHPGGCAVSKPAPANSACKCSYKGAWTCGGSVVRCSNPSSPLCRSPDASVAACILGGGDCDGYKGATCDCNYERGGCYISRVAPKGTACRCSYKGAWTCGGSVTRCRDENSRYCRTPDASRASCLQGGGDCEARRYR
jgi:glycerophosphoryl diester phosphodiesterase